MTAALSCEWRKILYHRKYQIFFVLISLLVLGASLFNILTPYTVLSLLCYIIAPLAIFMQASDLLSGEFASGEIKVMLTQPVARHKVLLAKLGAVALYTAALLAAGMLFSLVPALLLGGMSLASAPAVFLAYLVSCIPLLALVAIAGLIGTFAKSGTACFLLCTLVYLGLMVLGVLLSGLSPALLTSYLGLGNLVTGSTIPWASFLTGVAVAVGYGLVSVSVSSLQFARKEF